jgi:hypothetical protein
MKRLSLAACAFLALTGCDSGDADSPSPIPVSPQTAARATGNYGLTTTLDLPASLLAPQPALDAFATVVGLRKDPARTIFDLAEQAGVPHAQTIHQALPDILQSRLDGWINGFVAHALFNGRPVNGELDALIAAGARLQLQVDVLSDLSFGAPDAGGSATATHAVRALRLHFLPESELTIPVLPAPIAQGITESTLSVRLTAPRRGDALLTTGDHAFGLPIGQYMVAALDASLRLRYGQDLRGTIGLLVDCGAMAASVAHECVGPVCVGHEDELRGVCEGALDQMTDQVKDRLLEHDFKAIHFASGTADFTAPDRLDGGVWKASVNAGQGERAVTGRWSGVPR